MRAVVQRVSQAAVSVDGRVVGAIDTGLLVLIGVFAGDTETDASVLAAKISGLRIFRDEEQKMNQAVSEVDGSVLVVSQFTLAADVRKGRRPSFVAAARPEVAEPLVRKACELFEEAGIRVEQGEFGADMQVSLVNDGPITIVIETDDGVIT